MTLLIRCVCNIAITGSGYYVRPADLVGFDRSALLQSQVMLINNTYYSTYCTYLVLKVMKELMKERYFKYITLLMSQNGIHIYIYIYTCSNLQLFIHIHSDYFFK